MKDLNSLILTRTTNSKIVKMGNYEKKDQPKS